MSSENLHNNKSSRNFWCCVEGVGAWSATGMSAEAECDKYTARQDECSMEAGFMWQTVTRKSSRYQLKSTVTSFVPVDHNVELLHVVIENTAEHTQQITPIAAIPIYGRSADNIRDHRHVTSLLHQITVTGQGVEVKPKLSFDERGHQKNEVTYFVYGVTGNGETPEQFFPVTEDFIGEGGSLTAPLAVKNNAEGAEAGIQIDGKEALGGLKFRSVALEKAGRCHTPSSSSCGGSSNGGDAEGGFRLMTAQTRCAMPYTKQTIIGRRKSMFGSRLEIRQRTAICGGFVSSRFCGVCMGVLSSASRLWQGRRDGGTSGRTACRCCS